ncbi:hypothetical protein LZ32DRAFT_54314 [Colletotrichum eremochloae]|nr:hypothetical protein LZ32DRAFT_54314 [Colletotrichum eremochloae]
MWIRLASVTSDNPSCHSGKHCRSSLTVSLFFHLIWAPPGLSANHASLSCFFYFYFYVNERGEKVTTTEMKQNQKPAKMMGNLGRGQPPLDIEIELFSGPPFPSPTKHGSAFFSREIMIRSSSTEHATSAWLKMQVPYLRVER